jgi:hypothetical protein
MTRQCIVLLACLFLVGCTTQIHQRVTTPTTSRNSQLPTIKVDDDHSQIQRDQSPAGPQLEYTIPAGPGFLLDTADFSFDVPAGLGFDQPNTVQIIRSKSQYYSLDWQPNKTLQPVTPQTLKPLGDSKPFTELKNGQRIVVGIGNQSSKEGKFYVMWAGIATVR